jgi:hypothetical protein
MPFAANIGRCLLEDVHGFRGGVVVLVHETGNLIRGKSFFQEPLLNLVSRPDLICRLGPVVGNNFGRKKNNASDSC